MDEESLTRRAAEIAARYRAGIVSAVAWPRVGDPCLGFEHAPDCPAIDHPAGPALPVYCTRDAGHEMPHVADGHDEVVHVWVDDETVRAAAQANPAKARELVSWLLNEPDEKGQ